MNKKKLLNALYQKYDAQLTDEQLLLGRSYNEYVSNVVDGITGQYGAATKINIVAEKSEDGYSAYTDGDAITINAYCNSYEKLINNLKERHWCIIGRAVHECGHLLWTNFKLSKKATEAIMSGEIYPKPVGEDPTEIEEFLHNHPEARSAIASIQHDVFNSVEDGFIEKLLIVRFPGYGQYLQRNREFMETQMPTVEKMENDGFDKISMITTLILGQAKFYHVPSFGDKKDSDVAKMFYSIRQLINDAVNEMSSFHRMAKMNAILVRIFAFIKEEHDKQQQQQQQGQNGQQSQNGGDQNGDPQNQNNQQGGNPQNSQGGQCSGNTQNQNSQAGNDPQNGQNGQNQSSQNQSGSSSQNGQQGQQNSPQNNQETGASSGQQLSQMVQKVAQNVSQAVPKDKTEHKNVEAPRNDQTKSQQMTEAPASSNSEKQTNSSQNSSTLEKIRKDEVQKQVEQAVEQQIKEEANKEASAVSKGDFHRGVYSSVERQQASDGQRLYDSQHEVLDILARRMMKNLLKEIKERQLGDALDGNYFGNRLDTNNLYRRDKKLYIRDILPEDVPDMEVSILVDCSGSMSGEKIDVARKTAYTVWKFCQLLKIPVTVTGHNTSGGEVKLQSVADGDSIDGKDGIRIFSLSSGGCNRDGYALRYALNKLYKSNATDRIMFVISDGQPNHYSYGREEGKKDIRDAVASAKKQGIMVITAGIGSAASSIREVWIDGVSSKRAATFLELESNLEKLPKTFVGIIKRQLEISA